MSKRNFLQTFCIALIGILCVGVFLAGCGGGRNKAETDPATQDNFDIDNLLNNQSPDGQQQSAEDAEVLKLLGITPEPAKTEAPKTEPAMADMETKPEAPDLQKEVERLQREVNEKNQQVTDLRNTLMERDTRLQELEKRQQPSTSTQVSGPMRSVNGVDQRYVDARNLYEQRKYTEAIAAFQAMLADNANNSYTDNCQYWIGECYYGMGQYAQSIAEFEKVFTFTRSNKSDAALLKLGLCYLRLNDRQQARSEFEQLIANYPGSQYVANARKYLARL